MRILALTGSIGMGKSTTADMFKASGVPVHDADEAVHRLYRSEAAAAIEAAFPGVMADGAVDRARLSARVLGNPEALRRLESLVHPLVRESQTAFLARCRAEGRPLAVLDVPLLFETGQAGRADAVVLATADPDTQRARVLARPGMTEEKFGALLARQIPDAEKRRRSHFVIDTGRGFAAAERQVGSILRALASGS
jgi:dephospho-CoA kinase